MAFWNELNKTYHPLTTSNVHPLMGVGDHRTEPETHCDHSITAVSAHQNMAYSKMSDLFRCVMGPQLHRIYFYNDRNQIQSRAYEPKAMELCGGGIIRAISYAWSICYYTSPALVLYFFKKGMFSSSGMLYISKLVGTGLVILIGAFWMRCYGRFMNHDYRSFLAILEKTKAQNYPENKKKLAMYDFDFHAWPVDYQWGELDESEEELEVKDTPGPRQRSFLTSLRTMPCDILSYFIGHKFARPIIYPGSTQLLQSGMADAMLQGRTALLHKQGQRAKLRAKDGNEIDTMFLDKRVDTSSFNNGNILVLTCEGNAGFYELGLMTTPLKAGYSVLGWNHPGFGGSTGLPYPENERNAVDVVVQYAVQKLGFSLENIVIYAWSIGGYPASWVAQKYPNIRALVLDATFDDIVALAKTKMPESISHYTTRIVKEYFPLDVSKHLNRYPGPVLVIRRMRDEVITTEDGDVGTNRGNDLLIKLLKHRYPYLVVPECHAILEEYLSASDQTTKMGVWNSLAIDVDQCNETFQEYTKEHGTGFPMQIGRDLEFKEKLKLLMFLVVQYLLDFDATHCIPLPSSEFRMPWKH